MEFQSEAGLVSVIGMETAVRDSVYKTMASLNRKLLVVIRFSKNEYYLVGPTFKSSLLSHFVQKNAQRMH